MNYAHIENNIVVNIVIADVEWVNSCDGNYVLIDGQSIQIGSLYENGNFIPPQPYPSWTRDGFLWKAPTPKPDGVHAWDESTLSWFSINTIPVG
jgi:hypothetical protein